MKVKFQYSEVDNFQSELFTECLCLQHVGDSCDLADNGRVGEDDLGDVGGFLDDREGLLDGGDDLLGQPALGVGVGGKREIGLSGVLHCRIQVLL